MANEKHHKVLHNYDYAILESLKDVKFATTFLEDEGFDVNEELMFASKYFTKAKFLARAVNNQKQDQQLLELAYEKLKDVIKENSQLASDTLLALLRSKNPAVQFRKLDQWTEDEIREVLADVDLIKLMEELPKKDS